MINGTIEELRYYLPENIKELVMNYVKQVDRNAEEGYSYLLDNEVYGRVMSYDTLPKEECLIEAHNRYVDIQISVYGSEGIEVYQRQDLKETVAYKEDKDVVFFEYVGQGYFATIDNIPGRFSMFFPEDAHQPKICMEGASGHVKKFVVKIDKALFER